MYGTLHTVTVLYGTDEFDKNYSMTIGIEFESKNIKIEEENV